MWSEGEADEIYDYGGFLSVMVKVKDFSLSVKR